jgi:hypothetical protein
MANYPSASDMFKAFHQVRGQTMRGVLIDPGAARGLIGSETLRVLINDVIRPAGYGQWVKWKRSSNTFTGISPKAESSLGICSIPIGLTGLAVSLFSADVIGGDASLCPGLVPLQSLISLGCCMLFAYFANGDGVLGIWDATKRCWSAQRLYLTESGHYLLRIDNFDKPNDDALSRDLQTTTGPVSAAATSTLSKKRRSASEPMELFCGVTQCYKTKQDDDKVFRAVPNRT